LVKKNDDFALLLEKLEPFFVASLATKRIPTSPRKNIVGLRHENHSNYWFQFNKWTADDS